jgi:hypothetical protein
MRIPGVEQGHAHGLEVGGIARHHGHGVRKGSGGQQRIAV